MIYGIGTDVVEVSRIKLALKKHGQKLAEKILTAHELLAYKDVKSKENFLAKRFAAKEAFAKAFGTGLRGDVNLKSIEVIHDDLGKPLLKYHDKLKVLVQEKNIHRCHLSISDEKNIAVAFVILETQ
ncbi:MAG: holo-ACP synthase [Methylophilales bacterium]|nr:holo-ACP synthase [Pseudomonadota bacterium]NQW34390.1 holo-ACP synthase [Methylophilales bacterium]